MAGPGFAQPYGPAHCLGGDASTHLQGLLSAWLKTDDQASQRLISAASLVGSEIARLYRFRSSQDGAASSFANFGIGTRDGMRLLLNANEPDCYNARDRVGGAKPQQ
jgi:hypothetical protein